MQKGVFDDGERRGCRTREEVMERRGRLAKAHERLQSELRGDIENGFIDKETYTLLREVTYQLISAIEGYNIVWHLEDGGTHYPDNEAHDNDWAHWDLTLTAPISRANPMEMDYDAHF